MTFPKMNSLSTALCLVMAFSFSWMIQASAEVELSIQITDNAGNPIALLNDNDTGPDGTDFLVELNTSDATNLATYSQRIGYNSNQVVFRIGQSANGLSGGFGKQIGNLIVDAAESNQGENSFVIVSATGIAGQTGPQTLVYLAFDVVGSSGNGEITVEDNPASTGPYADSLAANIEHTSPGTSGSFEIHNTANVLDWILY